MESEAFRSSHVDSARPTNTSKTDLTLSNKTEGYSGRSQSQSSDTATPLRNKSIAHAIQDATVSLQELFPEETSCTGLDSYYIRHTPASSLGSPRSSALNGTGGGRRLHHNNGNDQHDGHRRVTAPERCCCLTPCCCKISDELNSSTSCLSTKRLLVMLREELDEG
eukprot:767230-Hanusia_phi.AAC.7